MCAKAKSCVRCQQKKNHFGSGKPQNELKASEKERVKEILGNVVQEEADGISLSINVNIHECSCGHLLPAAFMDPYF